jgi:DNA-binding HxlR family transcriptional regulator
MKRASFEDMNCSIARSLEIIGEWWTPLILREAFFGITRFEDFQERLGIARNILAKRLEALTEAGILERRVYDERRDRADYVLTRMGRALWPVMVTIRQWGDKWVTGKGNEPVQILHTACGKRSTVHLACDHCREKIDPREMQLVPGPGATEPPPNS